MKRLCVDDSATMRRIVVNALKTIGLSDVVEAGDGREALAKCDESVGLVITDWNMPNMGGLELAKALRGNPGSCRFSWSLPAV
jgi:two-component system, chemotaxis family, chemotaxis protein CheY